MSDWWDEDIVPCITSGKSSKEENRNITDFFQGNNDNSKKQQQNLSHSCETQEYRPCGRGQPMQYYENTETRKTEDTAEMSIHTFFIGKLIGPGGAKINEVERVSGACIRILKNDASVIISGSPEARDKAKKMIKEVISSEFRASEPETTEDQRSQSYDNSTEEASEILINNTLVGKVIGRGGATIQEFQRKSGTHIRVFKNYQGSLDAKIHISGSLESRNKAKKMIEEVLMSASEQVSVIGQSMQSHDNRKSKSSEEALEILIPNRFVGKVIGHKGANIQELQRKTVTNIRICKNYKGSLDASIKIFGSLEARNKAKEVIEHVISPDLSASEPMSKDEEFIEIDVSRLLLESDKARGKYLASLPPIIKNFYIEDETVTTMIRKDADFFMAQNNLISIIKVEKDDDNIIPNPITSFEQVFKHYPELLGELKKQGFTTPSPMQCQAWPIIMKGIDLIGISQTRTGKTLAFLFPALIHLVGQPVHREERVGPSVLILAPTHELAQQIELEAKKYTYHGVRSIYIYGGGNKRKQITNVKGAEIVIATPGILNDLIINEVVNVSGVTYLVLDEADKMLDLGFEPQIRKILIDIRPDRHTIMTSTTWKTELKKLAARFMTKPMIVNIGAFDFAAFQTVCQEIVFIKDDYHDRCTVVYDFIKQMVQNDKAIIFVEEKNIADDISSDLILDGLMVQSIHGDRNEIDRQQALDDLKSGQVKILIATDVAFCGRNVKDTTLVLNMYFPHNIEEYIHRVGRAGRNGKAISIFTTKDWMHAEGLIKVMEEANQKVPGQLREMAYHYKAWKKKMAADPAAGGRRLGRIRRY